MRVLVVAAHPDDEILGCGGTMARLVDEGHAVGTLLLGKGREGEEASPYEANLAVGVSTVIQKDFPDNRFDSLPLMSIISGIEKDILSYNPDIIFTHFNGDLNVDHRVTYEAVMTVCRPQGIPVGIYSFFVPSSTDYSGEMFSPNVFIDIDSTILRKVAALKEYSSEMREYPHSRSIDSVIIFSQYWGNRVGMEYVEPFILVRGYEVCPSHL